MTSPRRFEGDLPALLADLYLAGTPDYRDDLVRQTARVRQRPAWTFPERWIPVDLVTSRVATPSVPWRTLGVLALIGLLIAAALVAYVGSRPRLADPFGPAANGTIAYQKDGDLYARPDLGGEPRLLVGGPENDRDPWFSPDGSRLSFIRTIDRRDYMMISAPDGSNVTKLLPDPIYNPIGAWAPDGRSIAIVNESRGIPRLSLVQTDGSGSRPIDLGRIVPTEVAWRPPYGRELLVRGQRQDSRIDLYLLDADGSNLRPLGLRSDLLFGPDWDVSGPAWSPDGTRIAYNVVEPDPITGENHFRIHLVNADGTGDIALPGPEASVMEAWPLWSPDGATILVHRWTWGDTGEGWLAILPADGSARARDVGPRIPGGERTGMVKTLSPDGTRILVRAENTRQIFSIDPLSGDHEILDWTDSGLPDWQRIGR